MSKPETLCDWSRKHIEKHSGRLTDIIREPRYYCRKCARAANEKKYLCKPVKIKIPAKF